MIVPLLPIKAMSSTYTKRYNKCPLLLKINNELLEAELKNLNHSKKLHSSMYHALKAYFKLYIAL